MAQDLTPRILEVLARLSRREPSPAPEGGPARAWTDSQEAELLRPDTTAFSEAVARLVRMPLDRFAHEGCPLEIQVPWLPVHIWFVPTAADAEALATEGVGRGRIWTARELMDLLGLPGLTSEQVQTMALAKVEFGGQVVEARCP